MHMTTPVVGLALVTRHSLPDSSGSSVRHSSCTRQHSSNKALVAGQKDEIGRCPACQKSGVECHAGARARQREAARCQIVQLPLVAWTFT